MSISKLKAATLALMCATSLAAVAVPAKPGIIKMTQPDGTTIDVRLVGDERSHYTLSPDGYLLTPVNDTYFYATISEDGLVTPSAVRASDVALRSAKENSFLSTIDLTAQAAKMKARDAVAEQSRTLASPANFGMPARRPAKEASEGYPQGPGLFPGTHFPPFGEQKGLVILVEYTDVKFKLDDPSDYFTRMLNEPGFSSWGATGSAVDFFRESSSDLFRPQFDVYGPITLANSQAFYGGNNWSGDDQNPEKMAIEACQQLDPTVDFTEYDRDGDGYIDNVFIFYAGRGEASGGSANTVWPHAWNVTAATSTPYIFDGVQLDRYACSNEWESGRPDGVGTFVHEFSHVMGLPDLYATSYTSSFTPGAWSAMDYGPYNNSGMTPPLYSAFERYALGWIEPTEISGPMDVTLRPIGDNVCGIVKTDREDEYFLFENRQNTSWDTYIPGHGMLVWHIDYSAPVWNYNRVNNTPSHQYVDIEEADGTQNEYSRTGDSFPGTSEVTSFTAEGNPAFATWNGTPINLPLTGIAEADGVITFKVAGGREIALPTTVALPATDCTHTAFTANWQLVDGATSYMISLRKLPADPEGEPEVIYTNKIVGNASSFRVEDLEPETLYEYDVCVGSQLEYSAPSNVIVASTGRLPLNFVTPVAVEATDITETSFTANWEAVDDANDYLISLLEKVWGAPYRALCDFADGASKLPAGWTSSSGAGLPTPLIPARLSPPCVSPQPATISPHATIPRLSAPSLSGTAVPPPPSLKMSSTSWSRSELPGKNLPRSPSSPTRVVR